MKHWSIKRKILLLALLPATVIALLITAYFTSMRIADLEQTLLNRGNAITTHITQSSEYAVFSGNHGILHGLVDAALKEPDVVSAVITDTQGVSLVKSGASPALAGLPIKTGSNIFTTLSADKQFLVFRSPILLTGIAIDDYADTTRSAQHRLLGHVTIALSRASTVVRQKQALVTALLMILAGLIVSALIALRMARGVTQPILNVIQAMKRLEQGDLEIHVAPTSGDELRALEIGINSTTSALKAAQEGLQGKIAQATMDLRKTLDMMELQNAELDSARHNALEASKVKSEFLANMSHEIHTPMNAIAGFTSLILKTKLDDEQRDYIETIRKSSENLLAIINDILDLSKIESGKLVLKNVACDLRECLDEVLALLAPIAHEKNLELVPLVYSDVPSHLGGDPLRVKQLITNLVDNAIKFTHTGSIVVRVMLDDEEDAEQTALRISVTDTGIGIASKDQRRLFSTFTQIDTSDTRKYGGTGLGLTICKKLVEQMGGKIGLESEPGKGSTFWFTLHGKNLATPHHAQPAATPLAGYTVLLYEPHPLARLAAYHTLTGWGMSVMEAEDPSALNPMLHDAVVQRIHCPMVMIGTSQHDLESDTLYATVKAIKADYDCKVAVLMSDNRQETVSRISASGADACLVKPCRQKDLYRVLCRFAATSNAPAEEDAFSLPTSPTSAAAMQRFAGLRILVADDNPINRKFMTTLLRQQGAKTTEAEDGQHAINAAATQCFDVILMDIHMPVMNGMEASSRIRARESGGQRVPIIALTADALIAERNDIGAAGMDDLLIKPVQEEQLWRMIEKWVHRTAPETAPATNMSQASNATVFDETLGLHVAGGNAALAADLLAMLLDDLPGQRSRLDDAYASGNMGELLEHTHRLHGSACQCGVPALRAAVARLERAIKTEAGLVSASAVRAHVESVKKEIERLLTFCRA
ncbi:MAG: ATP-binding protein [Gammaproteobacteria bacterium]